MKRPNPRRLFVTVAATGLLAIVAGNSAHAGYQVAIEANLGAPLGGAGTCSYNFGTGGCIGLGTDTTGFVTPPTTPPGNSGTATAASAGISGGSPSGSGSVSAGAGPTTVTPIGFTFTIDGSMQGSGPFAAGELNGEVQYAARDARFDLKLNADTGYQTAIGYLDTYPSGAPGIWTYNAALTQFTYTDTFDVTGASGSFGISLDTFLLCEFGVVCDYGDTLGVALNVPSDVTLTSDSGVFPTGAPTPAPEPGTLGLLAFGIAGIAFCRQWRLC
jgi:PEP-CTERM motif